MSTTNRNKEIDELKHEFEDLQNKLITLLSERKNKVDLSGIQQLIQDYEAKHEH
jgi:hypothetical protein